jgi:hypothetical protein
MREDEKENNNGTTGDCVVSRRPANFTKADLSRAMSVARENGMTVEVAPDGTIKIVASKTTKSDNPVATASVECF